MLLMDVNSSIANYNRYIYVYSFTFTTTHVFYKLEFADGFKFVDMVFRHLGNLQQPQFFLVFHQCSSLCGVGKFKGEFFLMMSQGYGI